MYNIFIKALLMLIFCINFFSKVLYMCIKFHMNEVS